MQPKNPDLSAKAAIAMCGVYRPEAKSNQSRLVKWQHSWDGYPYSGVSSFGVIDILINKEFAFFFISFFFFTGVEYIDI